jgi:hypothetical protein
MSLFKDAKEKERTESSTVSIVQNVFYQKYIKTVMIHGSRNWNGEFDYRGSVEFSRGSTEGTQRFKGENLARVIMEMEAFILSLEDN